MTHETDNPNSPNNPGPNNRPIHQNRPVFTGRGRTDPNGDGDVGRHIWPEKIREAVERPGKETSYSPEVETKAVIPWPGVEWGGE